MKRFVALILMLALVLSILPTDLLCITTNAETDGYYSYYVSNGKATITYCNRYISGAIVIPSKLGRYPVVGIGNEAFENCSSLTSITIPDGVTSIGYSAFEECSNLTSITIPDSVTSIGQDAFYDCSSLTSISIPEGVISIERGAFSGCSSLTSVTIPDSVTSIGSSAFRGCSSLTSITIPDSIISIGGSAFSHCSNLSSITIPDDVTYIGEYAFAGCKSLTELTIPAGVTCIYFFTFSDCTSLTSITIPDSVTRIENDVFYNCSSLTGIEIPDSVTSIGNGAFRYCSSLTSITIPDGVSSIGSNLFDSCSSLTSVMIPDNVTSIGNSAFRYCSSLTSITIPDGVTSIGNYAFSYCHRLKDIYYNAGEEKWNSINIGSDNDALSIDKVHFYHEHDYSLIPATTITEATCTESGCIEHTCIYGETYWKTTKALGHDFSRKETIVLDNCAEGGYILTQCTRCQEQSRTEIPAGKHTMVVVPAVAATCTTDGNTVGSHCEICGYIGVASNVIPAIGHNYVDDVCANCGETIPFVLTDSQGNLIGSYATLADALTAAQEGQILSLQSDITEGDVILPSGVSLDLNGHSLIANSVLTYSSSAIIDTSENVSGLLIITESDGNMISKENSTLPVYDSTAGGYRFFAIDVEPCAVTGGNKYWFKIKAEKFAPLYDLINADADVQIQVKMTWDGQEKETYAAADLSFTKAWADRYNENEDIYITVTVNEAESVENFKLIPMITSAGVEIPGEEM